jgi:hypothetical protein
VTQSPELTGGAGFTYEGAVAAFYLAGLLCEESAPALNDRIVMRVALQQSAFGEPLDDVIVDAQDSTGCIARLSLQVKRSLTISDAASNDDFREIVNNSWLTLQKADFREGIDRYGAATDTISETAKRDLNTVCEWARASQTASTFFNRFEKNGNAGKNHLRIVQIFRTIVEQQSGQPIADDDLHRLFEHFVLIKFDFLHEGANSPVEATARLRHALVEGELQRAPDLWSQLLTLAREGAGRSEEFSRLSLIAKLAGQFRFAGAPSVKNDLEQISRLAHLWLTDITSEIDGYHLSRPHVMDEVNALLIRHRFIQIKGLPGTGKSVLLQEIAKAKLADGPILFLKSDRLSGRSWAEFANNIGLKTQDVEVFLSEIGAAGTSVLFIDGIDRIQPSHRKILLDLMNTILTSQILQSWSVIATSRDVGIEPLRNWVPAKFFTEEGIGTINVEPLNDDEADELGKAKPALRYLLFGEGRVKEIARRPFFAYVLAQGLSNTTMDAALTPHSEVDLIKAWWERGGYSAECGEVYKRQSALEELARVSAGRSGFRINRSELATGTIEVLYDLVIDGVIREFEKGVSFRFSHDIFFEWAYFYYLMGKDECWIDCLVGVGEPPVLGRVVELLSQERFQSDSKWLPTLNKIEASRLRPQWQRAWFLGPFGSPDFWKHTESLTAAITENDFRRLPKLFVWFQAEKTTPNTFVLSRQIVAADLPSHEVIRLADSLGWPSDFPAWQRLISWTLKNVDSYPCRVIPEIVSVFDTWQYSLSNFPNQLSNQIVAKCMEWLVDIEDKSHREEWKYDYGKWDKLVRDDLEGLEKTLRMLVIRAARSSSGEIKGYLKRVIGRKQLLNHVFSEIIECAPLLVEQHADELIELTLAELIDELPEETLSREKRERKAHYKALREIRNKPEEERKRHEVLTLSSPMIPSEFSPHDWEHLSIGRNHGGYFPASPLREPFGSLFKASPERGLAIVRDLSNHAMTAWRQLHNLDFRRQGTPIPIVIDFPWGRQEFWGDWPEYAWFRGWLGPHAVECALMSLEDWAFREIQAGKDVEDVLRDVIQGHSSVTILGIATSIAIETQHVSKTTLALLSCQRLWHLDLRRQLEEYSSANLIGFNGFGPIKNNDMRHYEAVKAANEKKRGVSLRDLTPIFALNHDEKIRQATRELFESFPGNLPFAYEEEKTSNEIVNELRGKAEIWAEWGKQENYKASRNPENESSFLIELENPKVNTPEVQAELARNVEKQKEYALWLWVTKTFENRLFAPSLSLVDAISYAKSFDRTDLFSNRQASDNTDLLLLGAVAGTAAAVLCFSDQTNKETTKWANDVIARAFAMPELSHDASSSHSVIPWHPGIFVARALAAKILQGCDDSKNAKEGLLALAGHPLEVVSLEALKSAFECWDLDDRFAWTALDLGMRLSKGSRKRGVRTAYGFDPADDLSYREEAVQAALGIYSNGEVYTDLALPPPAWIFAPHEPNEYREKATKPVWRDPDDIWRWDFAPKVLKLAPIDKIMIDPLRQTQFLQLYEALLVWTIEKINPSWETDESKKRDRRGSNLFEWKRELSRLFAHIAGYLQVDAVRTHFLDRIFSQEEDLSLSFLTPFTDMFIRIYILDSATVEPHVLKTLDTCIDRVLKCRSFHRTGYRDGVLYGHDLPELVRDLLFVTVENAGGAARFANGNWEDIGIVLPLVDKFVRSAGWAPSVASAFLTLCERCEHHYLAKAFADQVLAFWDTNRMPGWRGTILPARIAGLIQKYSDREHPMGQDLAKKMLRILDALVDLGDRRSAALQISEAFRDVRVTDQ